MICLLLFQVTSEIRFENCTPSQPNKQTQRQAMLTLGHTEGVGNVNGVVNAETASKDDVDADDHVDGHVPEVQGANLQGQHVRDFEEKYSF